ncbi:MAG: hypothetical protein WBZ29_04480 [Methanocella sp.]
MIARSPATYAASAGSPGMGMVPEVEHGDASRCSIGQRQRPWTDRSSENG